MKKLIFIVWSIIIFNAIPAQNSIETLKNYRVPDWWKEAKFGIFVHWGVYSVPSYADNDYAEWYWAHMTGGKT